MVPWIRENTHKENLIREAALPVELTGKASRHDLPLKKLINFPPKTSKKKNTFIFIKEKRT